MVMFLAWNHELSIKTILKHDFQRSWPVIKHQSNCLMPPNTCKLFSCNCNFYATILKNKSPVYHVLSKTGC